MTSIRRRRNGGDEQRNRRREAMGKSRESRIVINFCNLTFSEWVYMQFLAVIGYTWFHLKLSQFRFIKSNVLFHVLVLNSADRLGLVTLSNWIWLILNWMAFDSKIKFSFVKIDAGLIDPALTTWCILPGWAEHWPIFCRLYQKKKRKAHLLYHMGKCSGMNPAC